MSPRSDSSSTVVLQESRGHSVCRWRLGCLCGSRLYRWSCKVLYFYKYFHTGMSESFSKMLLWLCSFQCTKRTSWVSVRCPGERARLHLSRPARAASPSSSWCLFGWEGRPSTPPTSTVSRSLTPLNRVKRFPKKNSLPSVSQLTLQTIFSSRTSCSWTVASESSAGNRNILFILLAFKVREN